MKDKLSEVKSQKNQIRNEIKVRRSQLSIGQRLLNSKLLCHHLIKQPLFIHAKKIATYWPHLGEIDPGPILEDALNEGKSCYLPILNPSNQNTLLFGEYHKNLKLKRNRFGILEPELKTENLIRPEHLDLVLVPLVAFDNRGHRLGQGAGFYDRTFAFLKQIQLPKQALLPPKRPALIGLAYEFQQLDNLPVHTWDIPLAGIVTEKQYILFATDSESIDSE